MKFSPPILSSILWILLIASCGKEDNNPTPVSTLSVAINGTVFVNPVDNIPLQSSLTIVFSASILPEELEKELSITPAPQSMTFSYANQSSKVTIDLDLALNTTYQLLIGQGSIGSLGGKLDSPLSRSFTTLKDQVIYSLPPCTSASNDCLNTLTTGGGLFNFYSSFPIYETLAEWQELEAAILVVHGVNRDADNYFNFLMSTLQAANLDEKVVLIAPFFKTSQEATGDDLYWTTTGWRDGNNAAGPVAVSSFEIVDQLIEQLADKSHFPVLNRIIVTGHSSGGLFTHLYAAANQAENSHADLTITYIPANSQYYYYPDGQRINESNNQLYTPSGCTGYDIWPMGYNIVPPYVAGTPVQTFNSQFISRSVHYLLGNGTGPDPTLNTTDCNATLLGSTRYRRGENMFTYMETVYPGLHQHARTIVQGIGHDGQGMYQSAAFSALLSQLLN